MFDIGELIVMEATVDGVTSKVLHGLQGNFGIVKGYIGTGYKIWVIDPWDRSIVEAIPGEGCIAIPGRHVRVPTMLDGLQERLRKEGK